MTEQLSRYLEKGEAVSEDLLQVVELGIHHEKQHQELLYTDIKYILGTIPRLP